MKNSKGWFSLVEIIVATIVLTVWVFWIYKLFWNNISILSNNDNYLNQINLQTPFRECVKNIWYTNFTSSYSVGNSFSVNFWSDNMWCFTWSYSTWYSFSWINIDWVDYFLYWTLTSTDSKKVTLDLNIYNESLWELYASWSQYRIMNIYK